MEGENGSERENKCKLTPRYEKTPGSRVPREEKPDPYLYLVFSPLVRKEITPLPPCEEKIQTLVRTEINS